MNSVIFVAGVYGVGKSTLCNKLSSATGIPAFSAGDLISYINGETYGRIKVVKDAKSNQNILISAVDATLEKCPHFLLAGHFCIVDKDNEVELLPEYVFSREHITKEMCFATQGEFNSMIEDLTNCGLISVRVEDNVRGSDLQIVSNEENKTRIRFGVFETDESNTEEDSDDARIKSIVPFQLAYAVSIHKAQGLEYNSIKVVIPNSNSERITHGIFYTAITRTKEKLKIFWSADTMTKIIEGFKAETKDNLSIEMIKPFLS